MPPARSVRGRFELDAAQALRTLDRLERSGVRTERQMRDLGRSMDEIGGRPGQAQIAAYRREVERLGDTAARKQREMRAEWARTSRTVHRETRAQIRDVRELSLELDRFGSKHATAKVDVDGIAAALTQLTLLESRLSALGRQRARPRVSLGAPLAAAAGAGGGGGGRGGGGGLRFGAIPGGLRGFGIAAGLAGVAPLGGAAVGLGGSAVQAGLGAGFLGLAGGAGLAGGIGATLGAAKPLMTQLSPVLKSQQALTTAVATYGVRSTQAANAQKRLNESIAQAPRWIRGFERELQGVRRDWMAGTAPGQRALAGLGRTALGDFRTRLEPFAAGQVNRTARQTQISGGRLSRFATGRFGRGVIGTTTGIYRENLENARLTTQYGAEAMLNLTRAARPFFKDAMTWIKNWTRGWRDSTGHISRQRSKIRDYLRDLKAWGELLRSSFHLLRDLGSAGAPSGRGLVSDLTDQFDKWDRWLRRNPQQVREFFRRSATEVKDLAGGLWQVAKALGQISDDLGPLLGSFGRLVNLGGQLGLLQPGVLAALAGGYLGARGRGGQVRGGALRNFPLIFGGGGGGAAVGGPGRAGILAARRGVTREGAFMMGPATVGPQGALARRQAARAPRERFRIPPGVRGVATGAGRAYLPIAALMAGLDIAGTPGNVGQRVGTAFSNATFGLFPAPALGRQDRFGLTAQERRDQDEAAARRATRFIGRHGGEAPATVHGSTRELGAINRELGKRDRWLARTHQRLRPGGPEDQYNQALRRQREALRGFLNEASRVRGARQAGGLEAAFGIRARRFGPEDAMRRTNRRLLEDMRRLRPAGARVMGENVLAWARGMARKNPALIGVVRDMRRRIFAHFRGLGKDVAEVNGSILVGSQNIWRGVRKALTDPMEQARQEVSSSLTAIQRQAVGALMGMGFSRSEARNLIAGAETARGQRNLATAQRLSGGNRGERQAARNIGGGLATQPGAGRLRARGGRIWGSGLGDNARLADGGRGAPGELIVPRHAEDEVNADLWRAGRPPLASRLGRGRTRPHSAPRRRPRGDEHRWSEPDLQQGGRLVMGRARRQPGAAVAAVQPAGGQWGASPAGLHAGIKRIAQTVLARYPGLSVTSTTGGHHAANSYHYKGMAVDIAGAGMNQAAGWIRGNLARALLEGIHNPNLSVKDGHVVPSSFWGAGTWAGHADHIHLAAGEVGALRGLPAGAGLGGAAQRIGALRAPRTRLGGVPGALSQRAGQVEARALQHHINRRLRRMGGRGTDPGIRGGGTLSRRQVERLWVAAGGPRNLAHLMANISWAESGWNPGAFNPSGATGLWQILGALVPGNLKDPWVNALNAVAKYRSQGLGAWAASAAQWQRRSSAPGASRGGRVGFLGGFQRGGAFETRPGRAAAFVAGERQRERVSVTPLRPRRRLAGLGGAGGAVSVSVNFKAPVYVRSEADIKKVASQAGEMAGKKILAALRGSDGDALG